MRSRTVTLSTCVENTLRDLPGQGRNEDHLHIRGEYVADPCGSILYVGSPPHTWRIRICDGQPRVYRGITSTYVENTTTLFGLTATCWDHLHIRGEYAITLKFVSKAVGSPPHTWRIRYPKQDLSSETGITSTYVENTVNKSLYSAK